MAPPLLNLDGICLTFGGSPLLDGASLAAAPGDRIALVGRNGSGKSTLLKIAAGLVEPQDGLVFHQPGATLRYLEQDPAIEAGDIHSWVTSGLGPADDPQRVDQLLRHLGLDPAAAPASLSGGEARRAALARVLAPEPDILLLDEPTNHLDVEAIEWLEAEIARMKSAVVIISHDRRFLENVSRATIWLDRGRTRRLEQGFARFEEWRDGLLEQEERDAHKLSRKIAAEEHWLRYGVTARRKRNMRRLGELQAMRAAWRDRTTPAGAVNMNAAESAEGGRLAIEAKALSKSFGGRAIVRDFSLRLARGDRIGIVGANGTGKTTLLGLLTGAIAPDSGSLRLGANLAFATFDQQRESLAPEETPQHYLTGGGAEQLLVNGKHRHVIAYLKDFLFLPEQARTPVRELSGGEKARLVLAAILAQPSNMLVLDEPTNDLDMETLDLLEELVTGYNGTVLLVSHDRDFIDRTVTSTIAPLGDGRWQIFAGGYSDMLAQRRDRPAPAAAPRARTAAVAEPSPQAARRKLSYKQKFALETLPRRIAQTGEAVSRLEAELADPRLYAEDPGGFAERARQLEKRRAELATLENEWLELEILREELES